MVASTSPGRPSDRAERAEELFRAHAPALLAYSVRRGVRPADAEDVVGETFLVCFGRRSDVPEEALPWLIGVAHKVLAHHFRTENRRRALTKKLLETAGSNQRVNLEPGLGGAVIEAFSRLRQSEKDLLWLMLVVGTSYREAGMALGVSPKAVDGRLARALIKPRNLLSAA